MKGRVSIGNITIGTILLLFAFTCFYPFFSTYVYAFNEGLDSMRAPLFFLPRKATLGNFRMAFSQSNIVKGVEKPSS